MGIYTSGRVFGIQIYNFNKDDVSETLFEVKYDEIMSFQQMKEAYLFYTNLNDKNEVRFKVYTEYSSTLGPTRHDAMEWFPLSLESFLKTFGA
jgi:hypothetical protein